MKTKYIPMLFVWAALPITSAFAVEEEYPVEITESQELASFSANTVIKNNATLSINSTSNKNWSVKIESGSTLAYTATNDAFKWGTGTSNHKVAYIDNYGIIDMQSNKAFRFGDDNSGYSTTLNLYDGSSMTSSTGTFGIENYRGENSIVNVFAGASITNLAYIKTWDRNNESSANPLFELNVAGGSVSMTGNVDFGGNANANAETIQTSKINVTNGGTFESTGTIALGNNARNAAQINVSGAGSTFKSGTIYISRNADAIGSVTVKDSGKLSMTADMQIGVATGSTGTLNIFNDGIFSFENGTIYNAYAQNSTGVINIDGGILQQNSTTDRTIVFGQGANSISTFDIKNGGQTVENTGKFNMYLGQSSESIFTGNITGSKLNVEQETVASTLNISGILAMANGDNASAILNVADGGVLNMVGASANGSLYVGHSTNARADLNIKNGGTYNVGSNLYIGDGANAIANVNVEKGGVMNIGVGTYLRIGTGAGANGTLKIDGGNLNMTAASDLNIQLGYNQTSATSKLIVTNGGLVKQTGKNIQLNMYGGENYLEISNGAKWAANTNFYIGVNSGTVSTLNVDGGYITGANEQLTSQSSDLITGGGESVTSYVNVTNGGVAVFRGLNISQGHITVSPTQVGKANAVSYVTISGNGSMISVRGTNNTNYHNRWGVNKFLDDGSDNAAYVGNVAQLKIHTGAQLLNTQNAVQIRDSARVTFMLDSNGINYAMENNIAMLQTAKLDVSKTDSTVSSPFVVDGSALSWIAGASEGDIYEVALINASGVTTLNGVEQDFANMSDEDLTAYIGIAFEVENNTNLADWKDFGLSDISYSGGTFFVTLTYVPEPATYAALFGALALAFAIYRKKARKN